LGVLVNTHTGPMVSKNLARSGSRVLKERLPTKSFAIVEQGRGKGRRKEKKVGRRPFFVGYTRSQQHTLTKKKRECVAPAA